MLKGSHIRRAEHAIDPLFLDRWSPRAMTGAAIPEAELERLFEAARWAPSILQRPALAFRVRRPRQ